MRQSFITNKAYIVLPEFNPFFFVFSVKCQIGCLSSFLFDFACYLNIFFLFRLVFVLVANATEKETKFPLNVQQPVLSFFPDIIVCIGSLLVET